MFLFASFDAKAREGSKKEKYISGYNVTVMDQFKDKNTIITYTYKAAHFVQHHFIC